MNFTFKILNVRYVKRTAIWENAKIISKTPMYFWKNMKGTQIPCIDIHDRYSSYIGYSSNGYMNTCFLLMLSSLLWSSLTSWKKIFEWDFLKTTSIKIVTMMDITLMNNSKITHIEAVLWSTIIMIILCYLTM